jgi:hypothetical protein
MMLKKEGRKEERKTERKEVNKYRSTVQEKKGKRRSYLCACHDYICGSGGTSPLILNLGSR